MCYQALFLEIALLIHNAWSVSNYKSIFLPQGNVEKNYRTPWYTYIHFWLPCRKMNQISYTYTCWHNSKDPIIYFFDSRSFEDIKSVVSSSFSWNCSVNTSSVSNHKSIFLPQGYVPLRHLLITKLHLYGDISSLK